MSQFTLYRCWMRSVPGFYEQYDGYVDALCESDQQEDIFLAACLVLRRTSFPDRNSTMWKMERYEVITR